MKVISMEPGFGRNHHAKTALQVRAKAMLHWIRKREADKAAKSAREVAHVANALFRHGGIS